MQPFQVPYNFVLDESLDHKERFLIFVVVLWQLFHSSRKYTTNKYSIK